MELLSRFQLAGVRSFCRAASVLLVVTMPGSASAQPLLLGDLDSDGRATAVDLVRLIGYINDTNSLPLPLAYYTDLDENGLVTTADVDLLADAILGFGPLPNPNSAPVVSGPVGATNGSEILIYGSSRPNRSIVIEGGDGEAVGVADGSGMFAINVTLQSNRLNRLFITATNPIFGASAPQVLNVIQDSQAPNLFVDFPADGSILTSSNITVAGRVGDVLSGFMGLSVVVSNLTLMEGGEGNVIVGIGNNGTFEHGQILLAEGTNIISATARDAHGNEVTKTITLQHEPLPSNQPRLLAITGDRQSTNVNRTLSGPVVVRVTQADGGTPLAGKLVTFDVIRSDGRLLPVGTNGFVPPGPATTTNGALMVQVFTDSDGYAGVTWTLGSDAGCGNNRMSVSSRDIAGTVYFCATAEPDTADQINVGSGNNQKAEAGGYLAEPLRAWVSDSCNGVAGIPLTFTVVEGGGLLYASPGGPGSSFITVPTSLTGHAEALFQLGPNPGVNRVVASFDGNPALPAMFIATGLARDLAQPTRFKGLVLDNAGCPIGGAECELEVGGQTYQTVSDVQGQFEFADVAAGPGHLHVNGLTATSLLTNTIPVGSFPALNYSLILIPNAENSLPIPVLLPRLNPSNARVYDGTTNLVLTCEGMEGLQMTIEAGSMRKPDGSLVTPANPVVVALNQVHHDDVPMPMPDGASPPFAWTLQPGGSTFDPPVAIQYPNMSGLPPGGIAYFLSFNHDTERFEIVASGHVLDDGSRIVTDPSAGLSVAGWGCNCPPYSVTGNCEDCPECPSGAEGQLSGGTVTPDADVVCLGDQISFRATGVTDSGGVAQECDSEGNAMSVEVPAVTPDYTWIITLNGAQVGSGNGDTATITPADPGVYVCEFMASVNRRCPAASITLPTAQSIVAEVLFEYAGGPLATPHKIGLTAGGHDRRQNLRAVVDPMEAVQHITLESAPDLTISGQMIAGDTIDFNLEANFPSLAAGDMFIRAKIPSGAVCADNTVSAVIPSAVGMPHPTFNGMIMGENRVLTSTTSPAYDQTSNEVFLATVYVQELVIPVVDQFGDSLGDLYTGAKVAEIGILLNQNLRADSTYLDPVGSYVQRGNGVYAANDPAVASWPTDPLLPMKVFKQTQEIAVTVDDFPLNPGIVNRKVELVPPDTLIVNW